MPCEQYERMQEKLDQIMNIQAELTATETGEWTGPDGVSAIVFFKSFFDQTVIFIRRARITVFISILFISLTISMF